MLDGSVAEIAETDQDTSTTSRNRLMFSPLENKMQEILETSLNVSRDTMQSPRVLEQHKETSNLDPPSN
jgi:hypothetical protein